MEDAMVIDDAETVSVTVTDAPGSEAEWAIGAGLAAYNAEQAGYNDSRPLAVLVRDEISGAVVGGALGRTSLGLLFIDLFFLPEDLRGRELGSVVLAKAEAEGLRRGCRNAFLYTITFQAPGFYTRHGYHELGRIACEPPGHARVFMHKELVSAA
jgi:GNAT superfamily N-acetyltransferase